ncbi:MAG: hypothetical protein ACRCV9_08280, partial [Burkholderiaceae bacterium]
DEGFDEVHDLKTRYAGFMRVLGHFCFERRMDAAYSNFKNCHSERSEESCLAQDEIPRCARNDNVAVFIAHVMRHAFKATL